MLLSLLAETAQAIRFEDLGLRKGIDLGFFELRFYSLAYLAGIVLGYWHLTKMAKAPGSPMAQRHADDLFFYCTLGIILGGRLGYVLFYKPMDYLNDPLAILKLWDGGMSFHGGLIGVLTARKLLDTSHLYRLRQRWFALHASQGLVLVALWPLAQIYPSSFLFGQGQLLPILSEWLSSLALS